MELLKSFGLLPLFMGILFFIFIPILCSSQTTAQNDSNKLEKKKVDDSTIALKNVKKEGDKNQKSPTPTPDDDGKKKDLSNPNPDDTPTTVTNVYRYNRTDTLDNSAGIGDIIVVVVNNLESLLTKVKNSEPKVAISLFINGRKIENIRPISGAPDKENGTLQFQLDRNSDNDKTWAGILGSPGIGKNFFSTGVKLSVGLDNDFAVPTSATGNNFQFIRIHKTWFWFCFFIIFFYLILIVKMAKTKGLLRDRPIDLSSLGISNNNTFTTFSLARCQMAFWFTLTIISFLFIWLITDAYDIITTDVLALIGIGAGTSLSAAVIDNSKDTDKLQETQKLISDKNALVGENKDLTSQLAIVPLVANATELSNQIRGNEDKIAVISAQIERNKIALTPAGSMGFFKDILTDVNGISFHRLQMLVWTLVLGLIFVYSVWKRLSMPEFGTVLLALQGLTAGTYLGFKIPEKQV